MRGSARAIEWHILGDHLPYATVHGAMVARAQAVASGQEPEAIWLLEHEPVITLGTSAAQEHVLAARCDVLIRERGGQATYHGPGQVVVYVMLNLRRRSLDVHAFLDHMHRWGLAGLLRCGVSAVADRGFWIDDGLGRAKVGFMGWRVARGVTFHGFSINRTIAARQGFDMIVPCGGGMRITSLEDQHMMLSFDQVVAALRQSWVDHKNI